MILGGECKLSREEIIKNRALKQYGITGEIDNINKRVIRGLSDMMLKIWVEWKTDTRHYQPSQKAYRGYIAVLERGEKFIDPNVSEFEAAEAIVKDCRVFLQLVVKYRVREKNRVF